MVAGIDIDEAIVKRLNDLEYEHTKLQIRYDALKVELHKRIKQNANLYKLVEKQKVKIENLKKR